MFHDSPTPVATSPHDGRVRLPSTALAALALLATTLVSGGPARAVAQHTSDADVACTRQNLPTTQSQPARGTGSLGGTTAMLTGTSGRAYSPFPRLLQPKLTLRDDDGARWSVNPRPVTDTPGRGVLVSGVDRAHEAPSTLCLVRFHRGSAPVALLGVT